MRSHAMTPKHHFDVAMDRADHLLRLYDLLHDTRSYAARADWSAGFLELMHRPKKEKNRTRRWKGSDEHPDPARSGRNHPRQIHPRVSV